MSRAQFGTPTDFDFDSDFGFGHDAYDLNFQEPSVKASTVPKVQESPARKVPNLLDPQPMVTVNVSLRENDPKESFLVHKNFICHYSPYFDAAFNGNFVEGETQKLDLGDTHPEVLGVFVQWLYTQQIADPDPKHTQLSDTKRWMNLWILSDKVLVPRLQNETLRKIESRRIGTVVRDLYHDLYKETQKDSPLRKYFVAIHAIHVDGTDDLITEDQQHFYPHEMLVDLVNDARKHNSFGTSFRQVQISQYFVSDDLPRRR